MKNADVIRMANQIAAYFDAYPHEEAVAGVAEHINKFWEPRMRADLERVLTEADKPALAALVIEAAPKIRT